MKTSCLISGCLLAFCFANCHAEPEGLSRKIDGSSDEALKRSFEKLTLELSPADLQKFTEAWQMIVLRQVFGKESSEDSDPKKESKELLKQLDGKTPPEIIQLASWLAKNPPSIKSHPSDNVLIQNFRDHRTQFDQLLAMIQKDSGLVRVDYNWVSPDPPPITTERLAEYRLLLKSIGCNRGFIHRQGPDGITIVASAFGMLARGSGKGYYYSDTPPSPLVDSLDARAPDRRTPVAYHHVEGGWYLFND